MKRLALLAAFVLAVGGCASMEGGPEGMSKDSVEKMINEAEQANKEAAAMDGEWRDADKMIKQAKASASKGDLQKAAKLAKEAMKQGELGQKQSMAEKNAKPWLF